MEEGSTMVILFLMIGRDSVAVGRWKVEDDGRDEVESCHEDAGG